MQATVLWHARGLSGGSVRLIQARNHRDRPSSELAGEHGVHVRALPLRQLMRTSRPRVMKWRSERMAHPLDHFLTAEASNAWIGEGARILNHNTRRCSQWQHTAKAIGWFNRGKYRRLLLQKKVPS
jgi:hypothetical protein